MFCFPTNTDDDDGQRKFSYSAQLLEINVQQMASNFEV